MTTLINITKAFTLNLKDGRKIEFAVGTHEVANEIAAHWWTLEHAVVVDTEAEIKNEVADLEKDAESLATAAEGDIEAEAEKVKAQAEAVITKVKGKKGK